MTRRPTASRRTITAVVVAVAAAIGLAMLEAKPRFDDTAVLVAGLGVSAAVVALLVDRGLASAIGVGLIPGVGVALVEVARFDVAVAVIPLAVAGVGALLGYAAARAVRADSRSAEEIAPTG